MASAEYMGEQQNLIALLGLDGPVTGWRLVKSQSLYATIHSPAHVLNVFIFERNRLNSPPHYHFLTLTAGVACQTQPPSNNRPSVIE